MINSTVAAIATTLGSVRLKFIEASTKPNSLTALSADRAMLNRQYHSVDSGKLIRIDRLVKECLASSAACVGQEVLGGEGGINSRPSPLWTSVFATLTRTPKPINNYRINSGRP